MTLPHQCRYFHPLNAEAISHVAEDLRGEVAQGAVSTYARSQRNKHWNCFTMFQCSLRLGRLGPLECHLWSPLALASLH